MKLLKVLINTDLQMFVCETMKKLLYFIVAMFVCSPVFAAYTGLSINDLGTSTPTESGTQPREVNNSIREIKTVLKNQWHIGSKTANYTMTTSDSIIHIPSGTWTITVGTPTTVASNDFTKIYIIKNTGTQTAYVSANGGKKIEGTTSAYSLASSASVYLWTDGNDWYELIPQNSANSDNADLLNNQAGSYYTNASNIATGTVNLDRLPGTLTGKDADTIDGINGASIVQTSRTISTTAPITGGGDLSSNRTFAIPQATNSVDGYISASDFNLFNNSRLSSWRVGSTLGTGSINFVAGAGISLTPTYADGQGTVTVTGVGTTTAGGLLDTGTQSVLTSGYQLNLNGGDIVGITDAHIPNTITLDNITQITTRNFTDLQGTPTVAQLGNISLGTQTNGLLSVGTQTNGIVPMSILNSGFPVKMASAGTSAVVSLTTVIPNDDTVPQITEGTEVLTLTYTPVDANNWIEISAVANMALGQVGAMSGIAAIFEIGTASAIAANGLNPTPDGSNNADIEVVVEGIPFRAGTTTTRTYTLRCGSQLTTNIYLNATTVDAGRRLGGSAYTKLKLVEYTP